MFKTLKKFNENFIDNPSFIYKVISNYNKSKWSKLKLTSSSKPAGNSIEDVINISNFYSQHRLNRTQNKILFGNIINNKNYSRHSNLSFSLVCSKFVRTTVESSFYIRIGYVSVNDRQVLNKSYQLQEGDKISFNNTPLTDYWYNSYFYTKHKGYTVYSEFDSRYEISFSCNFFIFCYLIFITSSSTVEHSSYTGDVISSNLMVLR